MTATHTYAILDVSDSAYAEIRTKLEAAGYDHALHRQDDGAVLIDMHGIALRGRPATDIAANAA